MITCAIGSIVVEPHGSTLVKGERDSRPTGGLSRKAWVSPTGRKLETPGWFETSELIASARMIANGVQISPAESVNERRHSPSTERRGEVSREPRTTNSGAGG